MTPFAGILFKQDVETALLARAAAHLGASRRSAHVALAGSPEDLAALWNDADATLVLAGERFDARPLFVYEDERCLAFAAELKTLLGLEGLDHALDPLGLRDCLGGGSSTTTRTLFKNIRRSPAPSGRDENNAGLDLAGAVAAEIEGRSPISVVLPPAPLLRPLQARLIDAIGALRGSTLADLIDLQGSGDMLRSYYAGEPVSALKVWRSAALLLWWAEVYAGLRASPNARRRLVVYTVLIGPKESLANPLAELPALAQSDLDLDFVCITDNPALRSDVWRIVTIAGGHLPPEKLSRRPKALPHEYFPDAEHSLYIDNTVSFKRLPQASDLASDRPYLFKAFRHATRQNPEQEAAAVAALGYEDVGTICTQLAFYASQRPLDSITPLTTATVLLRQHHREEVKRFGVTWWESILAFSKRDQLSFDYARQQSACEVEYFAGFTHDNTMIRWQGSLSQHRVKASFDAKRYAWLHRDDVAAQQDPKAHFLAHGNGSDAAYLKRRPLLEFVCYAQGSSLGGQVSPRRAMAEALEALLVAHRREGQRYLLVRVQDSPSPHAFDAAEHEAAARAISIFMSPARGTLIDLPAADLAPDGKVYSTAQANYDLVIVLGAAGEQMPVVLQKLQRLLNPERGSFVLALTGPATLAQAAAAEAALARELGVAAGTSLHASLHDDEREALPNTVLGITWQRVPVAEPEPETLAAGV